MKGGADNRCCFPCVLSTERASGCRSRHLPKPVQALQFHNLCYSCSLSESERNHTYLHNNSSIPSAMKFCQRSSLLRTLAVIAIVLVSDVVSAKDRLGPDVRAAPEANQERLSARNNGPTEHRNPPLEIAGRDDNTSCGGDSMHHQFPWYVFLVIPIICHLPVASSHS